MRNQDNMRRTGRDRRDAGAIRRIRRIERARVLARSVARELKDRGLAWREEPELAMPASAGSANAGIVSVLAIPRSGSTYPSTSHDGNMQSADLPLGQTVSSSDLSWLPEVGVPIVRDGVRIAAVEVAAGRAKPFYVLAAAD